MRRLVVPALAIITLLASAPTARAAIIVNESVPLVDFPVFVPCANGGAGELVVLNGELHVLITFTVNANAVSGKAHFQPQGIRGTGQVTGKKYQGTGVTQDHFTAKLNAANTFTFVNNFRIIGQGPGNNFLVHETFHITINAKGAVTAEVDNFRVACK
jgi:hypothetical protein